MFFLSSFPSPKTIKKQKNVLSMCCEGRYNSFLCLCSHLMFMLLLLHVLCWGTCSSFISSSCCFLLFLLSLLKYKKIIKNVQPDVCRGGGHGSFLFFCLCFFFPMCYVGAWLFFMLFNLCVKINSWSHHHSINFFLCVENGGQESAIV